MKKRVVLNPRKRVLKSIFRQSNHVSRRRFLAIPLKSSLPRKGLVVHLLVFELARIKFLDEDPKLDVAQVRRAGSPKAMLNYIGPQSKSPDSVGRRKGMTQPVKAH